MNSKCSRIQNAVIACILRKDKMTPLVEKKTVEYCLKNSMSIVQKLVFLKIEAIEDFMA